MNRTIEPIRLPRRAPARVLATGAFLKNRACLLEGDTAWLSPVHGDLGTADACVALHASLDALRRSANGPIDAIAHDLHPDFESTRVALALAHELGVPAIGVQHHHAHAAVVQAEYGLGGDLLVALALDGVGLGSDGNAWGGEVLLLSCAAWQRLDHLPTLPLPGGDIAAREPWRLAAAVLHRLGRADEIEPRFAPHVGAPLARGVRTLLDRNFNCPPSSGAGRWFDAAAGLLGVSTRQADEAEAAIALERLATVWLEQGGKLPERAPRGLDLWPLAAVLANERNAARGAARFHRSLARALVNVAAESARMHGGSQVALVGGCFFNALLRREVAEGLLARGLNVLLPQQVSCGDAGLALGQAWAASLQIHAGAGQRRGQTQEF